MENAEKEMPEDRFERIGTTYYKIVRQPNAAGELSERRLPWSIEAIRQDYGKDFLANIPKYDGFCCVPAVWRSETCQRHDAYIPGMQGLRSSAYVVANHSCQDSGLMLSSDYP